MITKKSLLSIIALAVTLVLAFTFMHLMSLFTTDKWVGVSFGIVIFVIMLVAVMYLKKKHKGVLIVAVIINGAASGIALSSLFVYLKVFPRVWQSVCVAAAMVALMYLYCLATNIKFFQRHFVICILIYSVLLVAAAVTAIALTMYVAFILAGMSLIPFIAFLIAMPIEAHNYKEQIKHISYCSFAALALVIIVVLLVISQGDGVDLSGAGGGGGGSIEKNKRNPYDYISNVNNDYDGLLK